MLKIISVKKKYLYYEGNDVLRNNGGNGSKIKKRKLQKLGERNISF